MFFRAGIVHRKRDSDQDVAFFMKACHSLRRKRKKVKLKQGLLSMRKNVSMHSCLHGKNGRPWLVFMPKSPRLSPHPKQLHQGAKCLVKGKKKLCLVSELLPVHSTVTTMEIKCKYDVLK